MINFACDTCGAKHKAADDKAGRLFKCPECGEPLKVPGAIPPKSPANPLVERSPILHAAQSATNVVVERQRTLNASEYPWLKSYVGWLRFWGYAGNVLGLLWIAAAILMSDITAEERGSNIIQALWMIFGFNFLFVIAEIVRLTLDAKQELSEVLHELRKLP